MSLSIRPCIAQPCYCTTNDGTAFCGNCWSKVSEETRDAINKPVDTNFQVLSILQALEEVKTWRKNNNA